MARTRRHRGPFPPQRQPTIVSEPTRPGAIQHALQGHVTFRFIALALGFGFQVIVVKLLLPGAYATYAVLLAALLVGERLLSFGIDRTVLRFVPAFIVARDRGGLHYLVRRLASLRAIGLGIVVVALIASSRWHLRITDSEISATTMIAFGVWFVAYTVLKDADAVAQSLIAHRWAAVVAACEAVVRLGLLCAVYAYARSIDVQTLMVLCAATYSAAAAGLWWGVRKAAHRHGLNGLRFPSSPVAEAVVGVSAAREVPVFGIAAYASTLSYLISSPGVVRLVASSGLPVLTLAAFSFIQGLSSSLSSGLPGQLILPSLESIAAKLTDSGRGAKVFPALSVLFKVELTFVLAIIVGMEVGGIRLIAMLSRPSYAAYYYVLPILMAGLCLQTIYRVLEILGSVHLKYRIFLSLWPLSLGAMAALYFAVGRWGLISVLVVPIAEIVMRVSISAVALRHHGIWKALDPARSLRLVLSAATVLFVSWYVMRVSGGPFGGAGLATTAGVVVVFLASLLVVRPLTRLEYETLSGVLPRSWRIPRSVARLLSAARA